MLNLREEEKKVKVKRRGKSNCLMDRIKFCEEGNIGFGTNVDKI